jgi:hypothetical protein
VAKAKKRPEGYWARYYREHREQRLAKAKEYGAKHSESKRAYLREYYLNNKDKFKRTPEQRAERTRKQRERYANDAEYRAAKKREAEEYRKRKPHVRIARKMRRYGSTLEEYNRLAEFGCAICGRKDSGDLRGYRLHIDHDHGTGKFRGLLCTTCNMGIGKFGDDPARLERAALYLRAQGREQETGMQE